MTDQNNIRLLAQKWMDGTITPGEKQVLDEWYQAHYEESVDWNSDKTKTGLEKRLFLSILNKINESGDKQVKRIPVRKTWYKPAAAAAIILAVLTGGYFLYNKKPAVQTQPVAVTKDIPPGGDKAILTLADGKTIVLDSTFGNIASEAGVVVINKDGQLVYDVSRLTSDDSPLPSDDSPLTSHASLTYHSITTPRGGQYQLVLADGTKVWLDAQSSIRFPNIFKGNERRVELTGQAYFEVAHNSKMPFHVSVANMNVQVLGTHFNINSYSNEEAIKTTLLEGSVRISMRKANSEQRPVASKAKQTANSVVLVPGQQAQVRSDNIKLVSDADIDLVMAWKNGLFQFSDASLQQVMRQIQRWYDVDVVYEGNIPGKIFEGKISRQSNLSQVIKILQESGINFEIADRKLIVKP